MNDQPTATIPLPLLPMHLLLSMNCWLSSHSGFPCAKDASPEWKPFLKKAEESHALRQAVAKEAASRANQLHKGIQRYHRAPYPPHATQAPCIWRRGSARLLDYGQGQLPLAGMRNVALFIPSLINRYYILDLNPERSMLRYLPSQGIHPIVLDWGMPGGAEKDFGCDAYINVLLEAISFLHAATGRHINLAGYCMGGVLALAAARLARKQVSSLALFATPWHFHCREFMPFMLESEHMPALRQALGMGAYLPAPFIQSLFYLTDPWIFEHKFRRFARMAEGSAAAQEFVALERWVNDGVPMPARLAQDCLIGWAQENNLYRKRWRVNGTPIHPGALKQPVFMAIPQNDHVVPMECALPLANAIPGAALIHPSGGHVSMIVGKRAKKECWQPFARWLNSTKA